MKKLITSLALVLLVTVASAQNALKKVYNENINPVAQLDSALEAARGSGKFVMAQLGGNWCPWCLKFADFAATDTAVSKAMAGSYVYIHLNYNPRKAKASGQGQGVAPELTAQMLQRLGNPVRFGFPVFVVLDGDGNILHTQDSSFLEEDKGYSREKTLRFLNVWTPEAVNGAKGK